jgi:hypothetical protein
VGFGPDGTISGYESAVSNPNLGMENLLDQAVYPTNALDPNFVGPQLPYHRTELINPLSGPLQTPDITQGVFDTSNLVPSNVGPIPSQVGTFDPSALDVSGYTDQFIPTPAVAPRFTGVVGDTLANPSMPTPQPYFGQLGVPVTLAAGSVLKDALEMPEEEEDQGPIYGDFESDSEREKPVAEGFVTPLAYSGSIPQAQDPYSYGGYDEGALGRRLYSGDIINLENPFDLTPYFRSRPVFAEGGAVDTGFPMMKEIPADMQSKV